MKILVVTRSEWSDANSAGNTLTNLLGDWPEEQLACVALRSAPAANSSCNKDFYITEFAQGVSRRSDGNSTIRSAKFEARIVASARQRRPYWLYLCHDAYWRIRMLFSRPLLSFVRDFGPDVVFAISSEMPYVHRLVRQLARASGARVALYHTDDYCIRREQHGLVASIFHRLKRSEIKRSIASAELNFCITSRMARDYTSLFNRDFRILTKGASIPPDGEVGLDQQTERARRTLKIVYVGSLLYGRDETIALLARALERNSHIEGARLICLEVYSQYSPSQKVRESIEIEGVSCFKGSIPNTEVAEVLRRADMVLHAESFSQADIETTRYSFSTKIVDCLASGRAVLAIGPSDCASIEVLRDSNSCITITSTDALDAEIRLIADAKYNLAAISRRGLEFARESFELSAVRKSLRQALIDP